LLAAVVTVVAVFIWMVENRPLAGAPTLRPAARSGVPRFATSVPRLPSPQKRAEPTLLPTLARPAPVAAGVPTPGVFDFGAMTPPRQQPASEEERFPTNERFTQEDQQHPERYFEAAKRMPVLNRPEERRAVLEYFLAYREKLERDVDDEALDADKREQIVATMQRYDDAIARLRALIETEH
jgi:hypothetical protein